MAPPSAVDPPPTSRIRLLSKGDSKTDLVIIGITDEPDNFGTDAWFIKGGSPLSAGKTLRLVTNYGDPSERNTKPRPPPPYQRRLSRCSAALADST
jgi:hypothetical protein